MISLGSNSQKSSSSAYSSPTTVSTWNEGQWYLWQQLANYISGDAGNAYYGGANKYPGNMYVDTTGYEQEYLDSANRIASNLATVRANLGNVAYSVNEQTTEDYYKKKIEEPTRYSWEKSVMPTVREEYAGPGYWSTARADAITEASKEMEMELGSQRANLYYTDEQRKQQLASDAANRQAQYYSTYANMETDVLGTAGQYSRMIEQEKATGELQRWLMGEGMYDEETGEYSIPTQYNPFIQYLFQALGLDSFAVGTTSSSSSSGSGSGWNFGIASNILSSDREIKENIEPIDPVNVLESLMKIDVSKWNYIGGSAKHIGPMAQDFKAAFDLGDSDKRIHTVDAFGIALAAIQGLSAKVNELQERLECRNANQC